MSVELQIGDVVRHRDPQGLHCVSQVYGAATVAAVSPLVLVSETGDMRWSQIQPGDLDVVGRAPVYAWAAVISRLDRDGDPVPSIPGTDAALAKARALQAESLALQARQRVLRSELIALGTAPAVPAV